MVDSVYLLCAAHLLTAYGLVETDAHSVHRYTFVTLVAVFCTNALRSPLIQSIPGGSGLLYTVGFVFHSANWLCIQKLMPPLNDPLPYRWAAGQVFDARWGIRFKPAFNRVPSRWGLILWRLLDVAWLGATLYWMSNFRLEIWPDDFLNVPDGFLFRIFNLSAREIVIRLYLYFTSMYTPYCSLRLTHAVCSIIGLLCGSDPSAWPPLFGSPLDAYSLRTYYSKFWHQLMRKPFTSMASLLVKNTVPSASKRMSASLIVLATFAISAIFHILSSDQYSLCSAYAETRYYMSTAAAILLEETVIHFVWPYVNKATGKSAGGNASSEKRSVDSAKEGGTQIVQSAQRPPWKFRLIGYMWVICFDIWATSKLAFLEFQCSWPRATS
ncbi:hypothetical protein MMC10_007708 [Thelotrema lepadinum]|nr:hypothetical protein [Thelotrema lepadinum]